MTKVSEYVKTAEAAKILGIAQNTLRKWAEQGKSYRCEGTQPTAIDCSSELISNAS